MVRRTQLATGILVSFFTLTFAHAGTYTGWLALTPDGRLLDLNTTTGETQHPRSTGLGTAVGIAVSPDDTLYALSGRLSPTRPAWLYTLDPSTGVAQPVGPTGLSNLTEGDIACDPITSKLYGAYDAPAGARRLFTLNASTGAPTLLEQSPGGDISALTFDASGTLYALDTGLGRLLTIDKVTGAQKTSVNLNLLPGPDTGMGFDPLSGALYVVDGGAGNGSLYTLDPSTGILTTIGTTGAGGLAGLAYIPEPVTIFLLLAAGSTLFIRRGNRGAAN